jgi:hypothetical protein
MPAPDLDATLAAFLADPDPALLSPVGPTPLLAPAVLRLARRLPQARRALGPRLADPLALALLGEGPAPAEEELGRAVLSAVAAVEGGQAVPDPAGLEARAREAAGRGEACWWPLAAQVHASSVVAREHQGRRAISEQELPFVFPGELDPVVVDVLAVGARALPALHVDWARKLADVAAEVLVLDCRCLGLWFWPVLRSMATERLGKPVTALRRARRLPPGGLGLAAAYAARVGAPWAPLLEGAGPADHLLAALAIVGDRPA